MISENTYESCTDQIPIDPEEIVISGIAGSFPASDNMRQLQEHLFNKVDLVTDKHGRWKLEHPDLPKRMGIINNLNKFDTDFFNISDNQAHTLDPAIRILLERTYEAIVDAGINPMQLRKQNIATIVATSNAESQESLLYQDWQIDGLNVVGCSKSSFANLIAYWLDLKGPSYTVDTACSSSLHAVALAYNIITSGKCESAIVATGHLCLHPIFSIQFSRLGVLSPNGYCRPFDVNANGYCRSETVSVIYLQKAKNAKRIYSTCKHIKCNSDGYKEEGITFPSEYMQIQLLTEFYQECGISPTNIEYIETHGTGTIAGDPVEVNAIYNVFCKNRTNPLLIGSVKSNLGHAEPASGMNQIAKAIIAMETGFIPPMINFTSPREDIESLRNGSIRVVTESTRLPNEYIAINSFGFGGANSHMLLQRNPKKKINNGAPNDDLPRLVTVSGRTEDSVKLFLEDIANYPLDVEYIRLLHDVHAYNIDGHPWRGYIVMDKTQQCLIKEIQSYTNDKQRPVCFLFSGMTQWFTKGQHFLKFPIFARSIKMCDNILQQYNINVTDIITMINKNIKSPLTTLIGNVAFQIGLVDLLTSLGINPDNMIGYSIGELGCAYADKCLTLEQTILSAYLLGSACVEGNMPCRSMAIVNLDYETLKDICPVDITIACSSRRNKNVISGPTECVRVFMKKLQASNIHVQEIPCNIIPSHSRFLESIQDTLLRKLSILIPYAKKRSPRWISTSVSLSQWSTLAAQFCSAEYLANILTTVFFEQTICRIPNNAVTIEIAPTSVLQHTLEEASLQVTNIALTQDTNENPITVMLQGIGKLYNCGLQPQIAALYPPVEFPVSRGTSMISPSIKWDHSKEWFVLNKMPEYSKTSERLVEIRLVEEDYEYMTGHVIDGRNLFPAIGYVMLVWDTIAKIKGEFYSTLPVVFRDLRFIRATHLPPNDSVKLMIRIHKDSGKFEICEGDSVVVIGKVSTDQVDLKKETAPFNLLPKDNEEEEYMNTQDIYKELKLRGYQYSGAFRGLKSASITSSRGDVAWIGNWVTFMDTLLQLCILGKDTKNLYVPTGIQKLVINPIIHDKKLQNCVTQNTKQLPARVYKNIDIIISGGVEIWGAKTTSIARRKPNADPVIEEHRFVAHHDREKISLHEAIRISTQIALEDHQITKVKVIELVEDTDNVSSTEELTSLAILEACNNLPLIQTSITIMTSSTNRFNTADLPANVTVTNLRKHDNNVLMVTGFNLLAKRHPLEQLLPFLREGGYLLSREKFDVTEVTGLHRSPYALTDNVLKQFGLNIILEKLTDREKIVLLKKRVPIKETTIVHVTNDNFEWLEKLKSLIEQKKTFDHNSRIVVVGENDFECGLLGFVNCLRKEPGGELIRGVLIQDKTAPKFSLQEPFYAQQLQKDMTINILRSNKTWGSYRHFCLPAPEPALVPAAYVCQTVYGDLSTFRWVESDILINSPNLDNLIRVVYSSINFRDVMIATGKITLESNENRFDSMELGLEYVGFDAKGRRVMGTRDNKCIANVVLKSDLQWIIPDTWTFEEAATIPCVYATSYYALYIKGKMKKGDKVLIHSGSGGVGQSAIHLALHEGCEVFTTVGTAEKRQFIREMFPTILDDHIGNSHNISFEEMIMRQTNGCGVDIVLNSLAEEKLLASIRCLARNGRFLEIGKFDLVSNNPLDLLLLNKGIYFYGIDLHVMLSKEHKNKAQLQKLMTDGLKNGVIKPIKAKVFQRTEVEEAFRYMASGKHRGKIILNIQEAGHCRTDESIIAHRRYYCRRDKTYIILGGLGGFGLELTEWLISRDAKNIMLISRSGIKNGYQQRKVSLWRSYGVNVTIVKDYNIADPIDCEHLLLRAEKEAPVDAIFNLAVVLKDNVLSNQTAESFVESFRTKAWPTQILDKLSRKICPKLRHFVVFSSVSCGRGNAGQTNYGMANSVMERICENRVKEGYPGLAIQWGAVGDVGLVADMQENDKELVIGGTLQQKIISCIETLETFLLQNRPIVSSMVVAEKKQGTSGISNMVDAVTSLMNIQNIKGINHNVSLAELGIDSMMAVEIRQTLEREFDVYLSPKEIRTLTFAKLFEMSDTEINDKSEKNVLNESEQNAAHNIMFNIVQDKDFISEICMDFSNKNKDSATHVFLIPGIDGCGTVFNHLEPYIKFSATSLHYNAGIISTRNTLSEMVEVLEQAILPRLRDKNDFVMVGYSFGSILAIELAHRLENLGFNGRMILIDGAPDQLVLLSKKYKIFSHTESADNDLEIQVSNLINLLLKTYNIEISEKEFMEVQKCKNDEERFDIFAKHFLTENSLLSLANLRTLYITVYTNLLILKKYVASVPRSLKLPVTLLKLTFSSAPEAEEDYGLHKITSNVNIHYVDESHVTILKNSKVIAAISEEI